MEKIVIGCDQNALTLKEDIKNYLISIEFEPIDFGCFSLDENIDYPDIAKKVAESIAKSDFSRGILLCGTGIGMAIAANKIPGIRAACCHDPFSAESSRRSNNVQILTMGAWVITPALAYKVLDPWLKSEFKGGSSTRKVKKIDSLDEMYRDKLLTS